MILEKSTDIFFLKFGPINYAAEKRHTCVTFQKFS